MPVTSASTGAATHAVSWVSETNVNTSRLRCTVMDTRTVHMRQCAPTDHPQLHQDIRHVSWQRPTSLRKPHCSGEQPSSYRQSGWAAATPHSLGRMTVTGPVLLLLLRVRTYSLTCTLPQRSVPRC